MELHTSMQNLSADQQHASPLGASSPWLACYCKADVGQSTQLRVSSGTIRHRQSHRPQEARRESTLGPQKQALHGVPDRSTEAEMSAPKSSELTYSIHY